MLHDGGRFQLDGVSWSCVQCAILARCGCSVANCWLQHTGRMQSAYSCSYTLQGNEFMLSKPAGAMAWRALSIARLRLLARTCTAEQDSQQQHAFHDILTFWAASQALSLRPSAAAAYAK